MTNLVKKLVINLVTSLVINLVANLVTSLVTQLLTNLVTCLLCIYLYIEPIRRAILVRHYSLDKRLVRKGSS